MSQTRQSDESMVFQDQATILIQEREARYPQLLLDPWSASEDILYRQKRPGSGLVVVALAHHALSTLQKQALGQFLLHQLLLCGWYDVQRISAARLQTDPAFDLASDSTVHVFVGTEAGRMLAYFTMEESLVQSPVRPTPEREGQGEAARSSSRGVFLEDPNRPLFQSERDLFGPTIFASLPALRSIPVMKMRELTCLLRNQAIREPLSEIAVVEAIYTMTYLVMSCNPPLSVLLGAVDRQARLVATSLCIPILFAPLAPLITEQAPGDSTSYWAESEHTPGRFWPFVIAVEDLHTHTDHFRHLDGLLAGSLPEISRNLKRLRQGEPILPQAFVPPADHSSVYWTSTTPASGRLWPSQG